MTAPVKNKALTGIIDRLRNNAMTRIVACGSSNTERAHHSRGCLNWFDWVDLGIRDTYGRVHHSINTGVCGESTADVLKRFNRDVMHYQPNVIFITLGGNDCNPDKNVDLHSYEKNLRDMLARLSTLEDCTPILQTYYSFDKEDLYADGGQIRYDNFGKYMDMTRKVARDTNILIVDNLARWEKLRNNEYGIYKSLLRDAMHVNPLGNLLWGLDILRLLDAKLATNEFDDYMKARYDRAVEIQGIIDRL